MMGGVGTFSMIKRVTFRLSRFRLNGPSGSLFGCQKGTFSIDKNSCLHSCNTRLVWSQMQMGRKVRWHSRLKANRSNNEVTP
jgi:hypothetical protein